jgi:hypothetical protein
MSQDDVLKRLQESTKTDSRYTTTFMPKMGPNPVKLVVKGKDAVLKYHQHFLKWPLPCFETGCPICAMAEHTGNERLKRTQAWVSYVADLKTETNELIKLYTFGQTVAQQINTIAGLQNILDAKTGVALVVNKSGQGLNTKYQLVPMQVVDLTQVPQYVTEYEKLEDLETIYKGRLQDGKDQLLENLKAASLPIEQMNIIGTVLKEFGINVDEAAAVSTVASEPALLNVDLSGVSTVGSGSGTPSLQDQLKNLGKK